MDTTNNTSKAEKTDQSLVRDALQNADAFSAIVYRYEERLKRYAIRIGCRNNEDVNDILQEIFIKIYLNLNEYDERLKFSSWAFRITHNEVISLLRKKNVRPSLFVTEEELRAFDALVDTTDVAEELNQKMDAHRVRTALLEIDSGYRDVLVLKFLENKSYNEISDILRIPVGTVGTLIHRGKARLREMLIPKNSHE